MSHLSPFTLSLFEASGEHEWMSEVGKRETTAECPVVGLSAIQENRPQMKGGQDQKFIIYDDISNSVIVHYKAQVNYHLTL